MHVAYRRMEKVIEIQLHRKIIEIRPEKYDQIFQSNLYLSYLTAPI